MLRKDLNSQRHLTIVSSTVCLVNISVQFSCESAVVSYALVQFVLWPPPHLPVLTGLFSNETFVAGSLQAVEGALPLPLHHRRGIFPPSVFPRLHHALQACKLSISSAGVHPYRHSQHHGQDYHHNMNELLPLLHLSDVTSCYKYDALLRTRWLFFKSYTDFIFGSRHQIWDSVGVDPRANVDQFSLICVSTAKVDSEPRLSWAVQGSVPFNGDASNCLLGDADVDVDVFVTSRRRWSRNTREMWQLGAPGRVDFQEDADRGVSNEVKSSAGVDAPVGWVEGWDDQERSDGVLVHSLLILWRQEREKKTCLENIFNFYFPFIMLKLLFFSLFFRVSSIQN